MTTDQYEWHLPDRVLSIGARPLVMGVVNVTPDSFSDGGQHLAVDAAVAHALELVQQGADILDIGGESTRPWATPVPVDEELRRVLPVVERLIQAGMPLSIDTSKSEVAEACLAAGAHIINDVTALADPAMLAVARERRAGLVVMHMQGTPTTMQVEPTYGEVVAEIRAFLQARLHELEHAGIPPGRVIVDPGIGFGKTLDHNLAILTRLEEFGELGRPLCLGVSRKGFIGRLLERPVDRRLAGSLAVACFALSRRAVQVLRVHDVEATRDAVTLWARLAEFATDKRTEA